MAGYDQRVWTLTDAAREIEETRPLSLYPRGQVRAAAKQIIRKRNGETMGWSWPETHGSWRRVVDEATALMVKLGFSRTVAASLALDREWYRTRPGKEA